MLTCSDTYSLLAFVHLTTRPLRQPASQSCGLVFFGRISSLNAGKLLIQ